MHFSMSSGGFGVDGIERVKQGTDNTLMKRLTIDPNCRLDYSRL